MIPPFPRSVPSPTLPPASPFGVAAPRKGLARVEFDLDFSRQDVIADLRQRLETAHVPLHEIELPKYEPADRIVHFLLNRMASLKSGVVSITGWATAFPTNVPLIDSLRVLNYNRENIAQFPLCQIWWMISSFSNVFSLSVPDLASWLIVQLKLSEISKVLAEPWITDIEWNEIFLDLEEVRQSASQGADRFEKGLMSWIPNVHEIITSLLWQAVISVRPLGHTGQEHEARKLASWLVSKLVRAMVPPQFWIEDGAGTTANPEVLQQFFNNTAYLGTHLYCLALLYVDRGSFAQAEDLYKRALAYERSEHSGESVSTIAISFNLANLYSLIERYEMAEATYKEAITAGEKQVGEITLFMAGIFSELAYVYYRQGKYAEAEKCMKHSIHIRECQEYTGPGPIIGNLNLGLIYRCLGRFQESEVPIMKGCSNLQLLYKTGHPGTAKFSRNALFFKASVRLSSFCPSSMTKTSCG